MVGFTGMVVGIDVGVGCESVRYVRWVVDAVDPEVGERVGETVTCNIVAKVVGEVVGYDMLGADDLNLIGSEDGLCAIGWVGDAVGLEVGYRVDDTVTGDVVGTLFLVGTSIPLLLVGNVVSGGSVVIMVRVLVHVGVSS